MNTNPGSPDTPQTPDPTPPPPTDPAPTPTQAETPPQPAPPRSLFRRIIANPLGKLGAVIVGAIIGLAVETGVDSTGVLGPGLEDVLARQADGFALLDSKLDALNKAENLDQAKTLAADISAQVAQQQATAERLGGELRGARAEIERLRTDAIAASGAVGGAGVWLKPGESIAVGHRGNTFTFMSFSYSGSTDKIEANVNGEKRRMEVGDSAEFTTPEGVFRVVFKLAERRVDGRIGFDVVKPEPAA